MSLKSKVIAALAELDNGSPLFAALQGFLNVANVELAADIDLSVPTEAATITVSIASNTYMPIAQFCKVYEGVVGVKAGTVSGYTILEKNPLPFVLSYTGVKLVCLDDYLTWQRGGK